MTPLSLFGPSYPPPVPQPLLETSLSLSSIFDYCRSYRYLRDAFVDVVGRPSSSRQSLGLDCYLSRQLQASLRVLPLQTSRATPPDDRYSYACSRSWVSMSGKKGRAKRPSRQVKKRLARDAVMHRTGCGVTRCMVCLRAAHNPAVLEPCGHKAMCSLPYQRATLIACMLTHTSCAKALQR